MSLTWEKDLPKPYMPLMPFMPKDKYVSMQNPPDFTWAESEGASSYELAVATDKELKNIVFSAETEVNFHNFDRTFDTGINYWWAVRYIKDGEKSGWSDVRRFRIHPKATPFVMPDIDEMLKRVPSDHPRICTTREGLEEFRSFKDKNSTSKIIYNGYMSRADKIVTEGIIDEEPTFTPNPDWVIHSKLKLELASNAGRVVSKAFTCGFAYLLSGDRRLGEFGVKVLVSIAKWDVYGATSYKNQDQVHRDIVYRCAMAYDWLYYLMTDEERELVVSMLATRIKIMAYLIPGLKKSPYDSHGWTAIAFLGIAAIAVCGEVPEAKDWLRAVVTTYAAILPPWSYEDGGWAQGPGYWLGQMGSKEFMNILASSGILNIHEKRYQRNEYLWNLYAFPKNMNGSFGDCSAMCYNTTGNPEATYQTVYYAKEPIAKNLAMSNGAISANSYYNYRTSDLKDCPELSSAHLPLSHEFKDIGWITMSDRIDSSHRLLMTFKSSPYGSFNHSHCDENAFVLQAYGNVLFTNIGFYDAYHSKHDSGYTRKSHTHNTVTLSPSKGQKDDSMYANGHLDAFLYHSDFDLAGGEAKDAYVGALDRYNRSIIYIRPDIFVIIDDLKTSGEPEKFEWWVNPGARLEIEEGGNTARISGNRAVVDTVVHFPAVKSHTVDKFCGSDGVEYPPALSYKPAAKRRAWFETEALTETKIVSTLDVRHINEDSRSIKSEIIGSCMKLTCKDTTVYVNLGDSSNKISIDGYEFVGAAIATNGKSLMLVKGTAVSCNGKSILEFAKSASAVIGKDELSVSTYEDNTLTVGIGNPFVDKIDKINDYYGLDATYEIGVAVTDKNSTGLTLSLDADNYILRLNGSYTDPEIKKGTVSLTVNGQTENIEILGITGRDGRLVFAKHINVPASSYRLESVTDGVKVGNLDNKIYTATSSIDIISEKADITLNVSSTEFIPTVAEQIADYDSIKDRLSAFCEAENYDGAEEMGYLGVYRTRPFLSGGAGVKGHDNAGDTRYFTFEVAEDGEYDFVVKYVAWLAGGAVRNLAIGDNVYRVTLPQTNGFGQTPESWAAGIVRTKQHLTKGTHRVAIGAHFRCWNYDWLGLIKSEN